MLRARDQVDQDPSGDESVRLGDIVLRNRLVTSSSLLGYGVSNSPLVPYGMSPVSLFVPLAEFGAVTTRTLTVEPREGHFSTREDYALRELPGLLKRYGTVLRGTDGGWLNAFGWCNVGIDPYLRDYYPRTRDQRVIISLGGFSAEEFVTLVDRVNAAVPAGDIAAVEFNVSCHNVNFDFAEILDEVLRRAVPKSRHPVLLKLSPDEDYLGQAAMAQRRGVTALTAINSVKGLRLDPETGEPWMKNRFGSISGRAIKPIGLRVVAELRDAGIRLPIIATAGIRTFD
ncbi:dihydroorotate dehydrogenase, partial [Pseudonocardia sp.]|uniref:dihydroorotate dehydrogenase n=1 Tax=Pseudonocardia sp. TaxID=60912 RepID=UPI0031FE3947